MNASIDFKFEKNNEKVLSILEELNSTLDLYYENSVENIAVAEEF